MAAEVAGHRTIHMSVCPGGGVVEKLSVSRQREKGPGVPIHVVLEVKHFWESSAGRFKLGPRAVGILSAREIFDAAADAVAVRIIQGAQAHERPRRLRSGAGA